MLSSSRGWSISSSNLATVEQKRGFTLGKVFHCYQIYSGYLQESTTNSSSVMKCMNVTVATIKLKDHYTLWFDSTLEEIHLAEVDSYRISFKGSRITTIKPYLEAYIECPFGAFDKVSDILQYNAPIKYDIIAGNCQIFMRESDVFIFVGFDFT